MEPLGLPRMRRHPNQNPIPINHSGVGEKIVKRNTNSSKAEEEGCSEKPKSCKFGKYCRNIGKCVYEHNCSFGVKCRDPSTCKYVHESELKPVVKEIPTIPQVPLVPLVVCVKEEPKEPEPKTISSTPREKSRKTPGITSITPSFWWNATNKEIAERDRQFNILQKSQ
jgi:hypothetical protein